MTGPSPSDDSRASTARTGVRSDGEAAAPPRVDPAIPDVAWHSPWFYVGWLCLALAVAGAVLPLMPGTPFVLLAAWCFARSSRRWHDWLHASPLFGPLLENWARERCMPLRAKVVAIVMMVGVGGSSIAFAVPAGWPRWAGLGLIAVGTGVVLSIRTCSRRSSA
jgi:uncharacterized membrane protein YbaN (DUF454 family)